MYGHSLAVPHFVNQSNIKSAAFDKNIKPRYNGAKEVNMYRATDIELQAFLMWLKGDFKGSKQRENLLPIYVALPADRDNLLREYLSEFNAMHRYHTIKLTLRTREGRR